MAINGNYPSPVLVDGYLCWNCTDVADAQKHIDPAHPQDGPFGLDATAASSSSRNTAVTLGGGLSAAGDPGSATPTQSYQPGSRLNVAA